MTLMIYNNDSDYNEMIMIWILARESVYESKLFIWYINDVAWIPIKAI